MANKVIIYGEKYAIIQTHNPLRGAFAVISAEDETTVIIDQNKTKEKDYGKIQRDYRLIKFDVVLPFSLVGFIAKISQELAKEKIPIFVLSAYSTDYILVKDEYLEGALKKLKLIGYEVVTK